MWPTNLSVYTGDCNIFHHKRKNTFLVEQAQKLLSFTFDHPVEGQGGQGYQLTINIKKVMSTTETRIQRE